MARHGYIGYDPGDTLDYEGILDMDELYYVQWETSRAPGAAGNSAALFTDGWYVGNTVSALDVTESWKATDPSISSVGYYLQSSVDSSTAWTSYSSTVDTAISSVLVSGLSTNYIRLKLVANAVASAIELYSETSPQIEGPPISDPLNGPEIYKYGGVELTDDSLKLGDTIIGTVGDWSNPVSSFNFAWYRVDGAAVTHLVSGEGYYQLDYSTHSRLTVPLSAVEHKINLGVSANNSASFILGSPGAASAVTPYAVDWVTPVLAGFGPALYGDLNVNGSATMSDMTNRWTYDTEQVYEIHSSPDNSLWTFEASSLNTPVEWSIPSNYDTKYLRALSVGRNPSSEASAVSTSHRIPGVPVAGTPKLYEDDYATETTAAIVGDLIFGKPGTWANADTFDYEWLALPTVPGGNTVTSAVSSGSYQVSSASIEVPYASFSGYDAKLVLSVTGSNETSRRKGVLVTASAQTAGVVDLPVPGPNLTAPSVAGDVGVNGSTFAPDTAWVNASRVLNAMYSSTTEGGSYTIMNSAYDTATNPYFIDTTFAGYYLKARSKAENVKGTWADLWTSATLVVPYPTAGTPVLKRDTYDGTTITSAIVDEFVVGNPGTWNDASILLFEWKASQADSVFNPVSAGIEHFAASSTIKVPFESFSGYNRKLSFCVSGVNESTIRRGYPVTASALTGSAVDLPAPIHAGTPTVSGSFFEGTGKASVYDYSGSHQYATKIQYYLQRSVNDSSYSTWLDSQIQDLPYTFTTVGDIPDYTWDGSAASYLRARVRLGNEKYSWAGDYDPVGQNGPSVEVESVPYGTIVMRRGGDELEMGGTHPAITIGQTLDFVTSGWTHDPSFTYDWQKKVATGVYETVTSGALYYQQDYDLSSTLTIPWDAFSGGAKLRMSVSAVNPATIASGVPHIMTWESNSNVTRILPENNVPPTVVASGFDIGREISMGDQSEAWSYRNYSTPLDYSFVSATTETGSYTPITDDPGGNVPYRYQINYSATNTGPALDGRFIKAKVVATNGLGSTTAYSTTALGPIQGYPKDGQPKIFPGDLEVSAAMTATASGSSAWNNNPVSFDFQWQKSADGNNPWTTITNAVVTPSANGRGSTLTPDWVHEGQHISVVVSAHNWASDYTNYVVSSRSNTVGPVAKIAPVNQSLPVVVGLPEGRREVSATTGLWQGTPTSYSYAWVSANADPEGSYGAIPGAYTYNYFLSTDTSFADDYIKVRVGATNAIGTTSALSDEIGPVSGPPVNTTAPALTGAGKTGYKLYTTQGDWNNNYTDVHFNWVSSVSTTAPFSEFVPTESGSSILLSNDILGHYVGCWVSAQNYAGSSTVSSLSGSNPYIGAIDSGEPYVSGVGPFITGTLILGSVLTVNKGEWANSGTPAFTYQWKNAATAAGTYSNIAGATAATHTLVTADADKFLKCAVTCTNDAGQAATVLSSPTGQVAGLPTNSVRPQLAAVAGQDFGPTAVTVYEGAGTGDTYSLCCVPTQIPLDIDGGTWVGETSLTFWWEYYDKSASSGEWKIIPREDGENLTGKIISRLPGRTIATRFDQAGNGVTLPSNENTLVWADYFACSSYIPYTLAPQFETKNDNAGPYNFSGGTPIRGSVSGHNSAGYSVCTTPSAFCIVGPSLPSSAVDYTSNFNVNKAKGPMFDDSFKQDNIYGDQSYLLWSTSWAPGGFYTGEGPWRVAGTFCRDVIANEAGYYDTVYMDNKFNAGGEDNIECHYKGLVWNQAKDTVLSSIDFNVYYKTLAAGEAAWEEMLRDSGQALPDKTWNMPDLDYTNFSNKHLQLQTRLVVDHSNWINATTATVPKYSSVLYGQVVPVSGTPDTLSQKGIELVNNLHVTSQYDPYTGQGTYPDEEVGTSLTLADFEPNAGSGPNWTPVREHVNQNGKSGAIMMWFKLRSLPEYSVSPNGIWLLTEKDHPNAANSAIRVQRYNGSVGIRDEIYLNIVTVTGDNSDRWRQYWFLAPNSVKITGSWNCLIFALNYADCNAGSTPVRERVRCWCNGEELAMSFVDYYKQTKTGLFEFQNIGAAWNSGERPEQSAEATISDVALWKKVETAEHVDNIMDTSAAYVLYKGGQGHDPTEAGTWGVDRFGNDLEYPQAFVDNLTYYWPIGESTWKWKDDVFGGFPGGNTGGMATWLNNSSKSLMQAVWDGGVMGRYICSPTVNVNGPAPGSYNIGSPGAEGDSYSDRSLVSQYVGMNRMVEDYSVMNSTAGDPGGPGFGGHGLVTSSLDFNNGAFDHHDDHVQLPLYYASSSTSGLGSFSSVFGGGAYSSTEFTTTGVSGAGYYTDTITPDALTISLWVSGNETPTTGDAIFGPNTAITNSNDGVGIYLLSNKKARFFINKSQTNANYVQTSALIADGWNHILATWGYDVPDLDAGWPDNMQIYLNGSLQEEDLYQTHISPVDVNYFLGKISNTDNYYFSGLMSEFAIWDRWMNAAEASSIWNGGTPNNLSFSGSYGSSSIGEGPNLWYRFGQGTKNIGLLDFSTSGQLARVMYDQTHDNHGLLSGSHWENGGTAVTDSVQSYVPGTPTDAGWEPT